MATLKMATVVDTSRSTACILAYCLALLLVSMSTGLRFWARIEKVGWRRLALDDMLIMLATCLLIVECIIGLDFLVPNGLGLMSKYVTPAEISQYLKGQYIIILIYVFSISMPKVALLTFYHRVFMTKTFRRVVLATIGIIVAGMLSLLVSFALLCKPLEHIWKPQVKGKCLNFHQMVVTCNYMNLIVNIWVFILPIPLIQQLKVSNSRKLALCSIFLVGLLTGFISAGRIIYSSQGSPKDRTYAGTYLAIFSVVEPLGQILCCNLPIIFFLIVRTVNYIKSGFVSSPATAKPTSSASKCSSDDNDYWVRLCSSYLVNDFAPKTTITAERVKYPRNGQQTIPSDIIIVKKELWHTTVEEIV